MQEPGEAVTSFAVDLCEFGSKCGFTGAEYNNRIADQFILGLRDCPTQNKLLQGPPENIDAALFITRRFEPANQWRFYGEPGGHGPRLRTFGNPEGAPHLRKN